MDSLTLSVVGRVAIPSGSRSLRPRAVPVITRMAVLLSGDSGRRRAGSARRNGRAQLLIRSRADGLCAAERLEQRVAPLLAHAGDLSSSDERLSRRSRR